MTHQDWDLVKRDESTWSIRFAHNRTMVSCAFRKPNGEIGVMYGGTEADARAYARAAIEKCLAEMTTKALTK